MAAKSAFGLRKGEPEAAYGYTLGDGSARELKADAKGIVKPARPEDVRFFDSIGLAVVEVEEIKKPGGKKGETTTRVRTVRKAPTLEMERPPGAAEAPAVDAAAAARARAENEADAAAGITSRAGARAAAKEG